MPTEPSGKPSEGYLKDHASVPGDPLRGVLAGDILQGLLLLSKRARTIGGRCFVALYELADKKLLEALKDSDGLELILSNTGAGDTEDGPARQALHADDNVTIVDRYVPSSGIGHDKFIVYVDAADQAQAVLLGSTNWTWRALCGQSNHALVVESPELATRYQAYWNRPKADTCASGHGPQCKALHIPGAKADLAFAIDPAAPAATGKVWFSPNIPKPRGTKELTEATPPAQQTGAIGWGVAAPSGVKGRPGAKPRSVVC